MPVCGSSERLFVGSDLKAPGAGKQVEGDYNVATSYNFSERELRILEQGAVRCVDFRASYGDLKENDLPPSLAGRLTAHQVDCPHCTEFKRGYEEVVTLAAELPERPIPSDVQARLRAALNVRLGLHL